jgi:hypothetical protein
VAIQWTRTARIGAFARFHLSCLCVALGTAHCGGASCF